jgi:surface antigen
MTYFRRKLLEDRHDCSRAMLPARTDSEVGLKIPSMLALAVAALAFAGCSSLPNQGEGLNAYASNTNVVAGGTMIDGLAGSQIGRNLDDGDLQAAATAEFRALEYGKTGTPVAWRGRSGAFGEVVPGASYQVNSLSCREFTHTIYVKGQPQAARGTACREANGSWRTVT